VKRFTEQHGDLALKTCKDCVHWVRRTHGDTGDCCVETPDDDPPSDAPSHHPACFQFWARERTDGLA
jgi:hypothetical protein